LKNNDIKISNENYNDDNNYFLDDSGNVYMSLARMMYFYDAI